MEIVKVSLKSARFFVNVAPASAIALLSMPNAAAIGAVEDGHAIGLLIFTSQGNESITIEWLYVDEEYRGLGIGAMLIEKIFDITMNLKIQNIYAHLVEEDDYDAMELYLMNWGFGWLDTLAGEWNITVKDLVKTEFAKKTLAIETDKMDIRSVSKVSPKLLSKACEKAKKDGKTILYDPSDYHEYLDPELSKVVISNDKVVGMLLVHRYNHFLYPVALWSEKGNPKTTASLIGASIKAGISSLKATDIIRITAVSEEAEAIINQIFDDLEPRPVYMMQAPAVSLAQLSYFDINSALDGAYARKDLFSPEDIPLEGYTVDSVEVG